MSNVYGYKFAHILFQLMLRLHTCLSESQGNPLGVAVSSPYDLFHIAFFLLLLIYQAIWSWPESLSGQTVLSLNINRKGFFFFFLST